MKCCIMIIYFMLYNMDCVVSFTFCDICNEVPSMFCDGCFIWIKNMSQVFCV